MLSSRRPILAALVVAASTGLLLSGCSSASSAPAAEPTPDVDVVDLSEAGDPTPPGTTLGLGDPGWVEDTVNAEDGDDLLLYGVTVLAVEEQDADFWEETTSNPEDFDGYTPVVIVIEQRVETETADDEATAELDLYPALSDGTPGSDVTTSWGGNADDCGGLTLPEPPDDSTQVGCLVGAAGEGEEIVGAMWNATSPYAVFADDDNAYQQEPVVWSDAG